MENDDSFQPSKKTMKSNNKNSSESNAVPDFIQKLFRMLENKAFHDVFCWDNSGTSFLVKDTNEFSKSILPQHFKHCNFASFVRQLNKYGFHKIRSNNMDEAQRLYGDQTWEFEHENFIRDRKDLLEEIKRKTPAKKKAPTKPIVKVEPSTTLLPPPQPPSTKEKQMVEELQSFIQNLQSQISQLQQSQNELEDTISSMDKKDKHIMAELSEFQSNLKKKDDIIKECLKLTPAKQKKLQNNNNWTQNMLTDLLLPSTSTSSNQLNNASLIGPPMKAVDGLTFLALNRLDTNTNNQPQSNQSQPQQEMETPSVTPTTTAPTTTNTSETKGKKRMMTTNWTTAPRVLLVDDDSVYRDVSGRMLTMIGCSIDLAKDGLEALQKISLEKYDLILMDIVMPKMDGIATTKNIRRYDSVTPIVSMTSNFTHNDIMEYIGIGMNDILPKPFSKNTLYDILEKHCAHLKAIKPDNVDTPSTTPSSSSANNSPTLGSYWQPIVDKKLVWSSSSTTTPYQPTTSITSPTLYQNNNKRQKLNSELSSLPY